MEYNNGNVDVIRKRVKQNIYRCVWTRHIVDGSADQSRGRRRVNNSSGRAFYLEDRPSQSRSPSGISSFTSEPDVGG
jgi:hypothetical protein